jgi:hypothetical protein
MKTRLVIAALVTMELACAPFAGALAAQRTHHRHASPALSPSAGSRGLNAYAAVGPGISNDRATYLKNLRDSGYDPRNDFNEFGNVPAVPDGGG